MDAKFEAMDAKFEAKFDTLRDDILASEKRIHLHLHDQQAVKTQVLREASRTVTICESEVTAHFVLLEPFIFVISVAHFPCYIGDSIPDYISHGQLFTKPLIRNVRAGQGVTGQACDRSHPHLQEAAGWTSRIQLHHLCEENGTAPVRQVWGSGESHDDPSESGAAGAGHGKMPETSGKQSSRG